MGSAVPERPPPLPSGEVSLATVTRRLHPAVLDVLVAPRGLETTVSEPFVLDPQDPLPPPARSIVLAVGVERAEVSRLLHRLAATATAVVVKDGGAVPDDTLADAAEASGVAVLSCPAALSWGQLYSLLLTAAAPARGGATAGDVPLGDLFALANAVAAMVGGATTIEDAQNRVLAYSNLDQPIDPPRQQTILGRQVPQAWIRRLQEAGVFRRLWQSNEVVRIADFVADEPGYRPRIAVAVRAGGELLGSLWVIEGERALDAEAERALRGAAEIAALHLLRHRAASDVERRRRTEALLSVLDGAESGEPARAALGLAEASRVAVVAFDAGGDGGAEADAVVSAQRVADLVAVYSESYRRRAACASTGGRAYALVPVDPDRGEAAVESFARAVVERAAQALRLPLVAGVGATVASLEEVPRSRADADSVVELLLAGDRPAVATIAARHAQVVLARLAAIAAEHPELTRGRLTALAEQDRARGTAWIPTLRAYLDAFGDMVKAAARLGVHPNTFRYRLRRIIDVHGLDLDDPDERLVAELQLRFLR